jgi:hypothetical protein
MGNGALGAEASICAHAELRELVLGLRLARHQRADHRTEESQRDADDAGILERKDRPRAQDARGERDRLLLVVDLFASILDGVFDLVSHLSSAFAHLVDRVVDAVARGFSALADILHGFVDFLADSLPAAFLLAGGEQRHHH